MTAVQVRVGEISEQIRGVTYGKGDASDTAQDGYLPVLRAGNITDSGAVFDDLVYVPAGQVSPKQLLRSGDVLIAASSGSLDVVGKAAPILSDYQGAFGAFCKVLRPNQSRVHPSFFAHFFKTVEYRRIVSSLAAGANINNLRNEHLDDLLIPLPPLPEQRRIAAILDKADALRTKRREALAQLDHLAQSIFVEMFGDPTPTRTKYETSSLSAACKKISDGTHHSPPIQDIGIPYITAKHLKREGLDFFADPWFVSKEDHAQIYSRCDPVKGDVLYIKDGATTGIAAINEYDFPFSMLSSLALLRPDNGKLTSDYLCAWLNYPQIKTEILGAMAGAAIRRLTLAQIKAIEIPLPPLHLQQEFATKLSHIRLLRTSGTAALTEQDRLFDSLQHRAFRGEL